MKNRPTNQHHVPQVYLRNFCNENSEIAVLNKSTNKIFSTGTSRVGVEKNFYTLDKHKNPYCWEDYYGKIVEPLMGKLLRQIRCRCNNKLVAKEHSIINEEEKNQLAFIMVMQLLRGKESEKKIAELYHEFLPSVLKEAKDKFGPLTKDQLELLCGLKKDKYYLKATAMQVILDENQIKKYVDVFKWRRFVFFHSCDGIEFVTSDNPVMFMNSKTANVFPFTNGLKEKTTLVYFPISPNIILSAIHPNIFYRFFKDKEGFIFNIQERSFVDFVNKKQSEQCYNQVYARSEVTLQNMIK